MKNLFDYDFLVNEVFYKCWHILDYIEKNPQMPDLDRKAIQATIMDALVYRNLIDINRQSIDLDNLCIRDDVNYYTFERCPDVCGIFQWMKEEFRKKCIVISGGIPISMFLAKPPSKVVRYCVYDPNTAVSSIFSDATFYNVFYTSPTRGVRIDDYRPFVEVEIAGELYLVDTLTKRVFKSSFFKENYGFEIVNQVTISKMSEDKRRFYQEQISANNNLEVIIPFWEMTMEVLSKDGNQAEMMYEFLKCKEYYPESFAKAEELKRMLNKGL